MLELAVEVTAHPAVEKKDKGQNGGGERSGERGGFPAVVEMVVETDEDQTKQPDEADQSAEGHDKLAECLAFALASKSGRSVGESGHVRGAEGAEKVRARSAGVNRISRPGGGFTAAA